jgi:tetratricopeptide (TPR) repeat protein
MNKLCQLTSFAQNYEKNGDYKNAEDLFFRVLHLKTRILGRHYPGCGTDLYNLGLLNFSLSNYDRARQLLVRALQIHRKERKNRQQDVNQTLQTLAQLRREKSLN